MAMKEVTQPNADNSVEKNVERLRDQLVRFDTILSQGSRTEALKAFDADMESLLAEVFGNPSEILEAYAYAQLGEAGAWINLPEEAQLEGAQDVARLSIQQRRGVIEQAIVEVEARGQK